MILITGGTGFLGAHVISLLVSSGQKVRATRRETSIIPKGLVDHPQVEWVTCDILDYFVLEAAFKDVSQVYHCAAFVSYNPAHKKLMLKTNIEGTAHVVNLSLKNKARMVHVSSIAAIGLSKNKDAPIIEDDIWEFSPRQSDYAISKYESEMEVWRGIAEGLDAVIVNPSLVLGASAGSKGSGSVFYLLAKGLKFYTDGSVGLVDVTDVAKAMITLMGIETTRGNRYIISNTNMTHKKLLTLASDLLNRPAPSILARPYMLGIAWRMSSLQAFLTGKKSVLTKASVQASVQKLSYSNKKFVDETGFQFRPIEQTLAEICAAVLKNQKK